MLHIIVNWKHFANILKAKNCLRKKKSCFLKAMKKKNENQYFPEGDNFIWNMKQDNWKKTLQ